MRTFIFTFYDSPGSAMKINARNLTSALNKLPKNRCVEHWEEEPKGLTTRQWRLKDYLEEHRGEGFITIERICKEVVNSDGVPYYILNKNPYNHDKCAVLSQDVRDINWNNVDGYQIIIKDAKGSIKYADTLDEFESWRKKELAKVEPKYQYLNNLKFKAHQDGTMPLYNKKLNPVGEDLKEVDVFKGGK